MNIFECRKLQTFMLIGIIVSTFSSLIYTAVYKHKPLTSFVAKNVHEDINAGQRESYHSTPEYSTDNLMKSDEVSVKLATDRLSEDGVSDEQTGFVDASNQDDGETTEGITETTEAYGSETPTSIQADKVEYFNHDELASTYELTPSAAMCSREHTYLMYVMSAAYHYDNRKLIRKTWANDEQLAKYTKHGFHVDHIFVIGGLQFLDSDTAKRIREESEIHKDILTIDNLLDSYNNLTKKTIHTMYWIRANCDLKNVEYMLKSDDDVIVNMFSVLDRAWQAVNRPTVTHFICHYLGQKWVERTGKYAEPVWRYPGEKYPRYCSGPAYTLHKEIFLRLFDCLPWTPIMQSEDVMLTGVCRHNITTTTNFKIKVEPLPMSSYITEVNEVYMHFGKKLNISSFERFILSHEFPLEKWLEAYEQLVDHYLDNSTDTS